MTDGYYWARHDDGTTFVVLLEGGDWYTVGILAPITDTFRECQVICAVPRPAN